MNLIQHLFESSIQTQQKSLPVLIEPLQKAGQLLNQAMQTGHRLLICGNGGSAADAQHFASELVNRFEKERPALPAIALSTDSSILTSIANDTDFKLIFARQVQALGRAGDILLAISTSGQSDNIIEAVKTAHQQSMRIIALTGRRGGRLVSLLNKQDIALIVPSEQTARIQEVHLICIHCLCAQIDAQF